MVVGGRGGNKVFVSDDDVVVVFGVDVVLIS